MTAVAAMSHLVLVVDDDPHIRELLAFALARTNMRTEEAADGEAALEAVGRCRPDLIILDINMPRLDGLEVCRRLRADPDHARLPILFLSSRDDEVDRILGIELGGDDYVVKPFSPREVAARVGAILKRTAAPAPVLPTEPSATGRGQLRLNGDSWEASFDGRPVATTATEFRLLMLLVQAAPRVLSRDMIIDQLHGPGFAITDRTIDSHVRNLRAKFAAAGCSDLIETRPGIGYRIGACG